MTRAPCRQPDSVDPGPLKLVDQPEAASRDVERLAYRLDEVAKALGVSRRLIERERSAGRFPRPDLTIGRAPLWTRETLTGWIAQGGGRPC
jgi:predicted DNA-binding transcriptional regulator AlpA